MYLKDIMKDVGFKGNGKMPSLEINNVTNDSRKVKEGDLFVAVKGCALNGCKFIDEAVARGAKAILAEDDFVSPKGVTKILVEDTRTALPAIADNFYGRPSQKLKAIGVTGTNGKTTITYIIESIIKNNGENAGVIGTVNYRIKDRVSPSKNTTPGPLELQAMLAEMVKEGVGYVVIEVSSHSLDQRRVDRLLFDAAIFTNVTSEHLDYHKTIDNYFKTKARLFDNLKEDAVAILNNDDKKVASLSNSIKNKVMTYGIREAADIVARDVRLSLDGSRFTVHTHKASFEINTRLIGMYNVSNILASIAAALVLNIDIDVIKKGVEAVNFVPGRLELVDAGQLFKIFVDYAHTEDALNNVLGLLKEVAKGDIITVFGCGGNRDTEKRPLMGKAACKFSDKVIITSDNPRFEEPGRIIDEIEKGIKGKFSNYEIVDDRRKAIDRAIGLASEGDTVIIAGKGHEDYQIIKDKVIPFDDRLVAMEILKRKGYEGKRDNKNNQRGVAVR